MSDELFEVEDAVGIVMHFRSNIEGVVPAMKDPELILTHHCWLAIGQDGPIIYSRKYADSGSLNSAGSDCRYSMTYDGEVDNMEEAKSLFAEAVATWMKRLFK